MVTTPIISLLLLPQNDVYDDLKYTFYYYKSEKNKPSLH